ncbi:MAG: DUF1553 domain-containing protein [Pirellulales bacterium]|nr:DUF1553 domain-containing protein [Pirellulales bacterium]
MSVFFTSNFTSADEQASPAVGSEITEVDPQAIAFFENKIRPLLAENCYECHGEEEQESDLRVDSLVGLMRGGEGYGAAIVPGNPGGSILISAVKHQELTMPPEKKLSARQIEDLVHWIKMGAPWPGSTGAHKDINDIDTEQGITITDEDRSWWSYQPVVHPEIPQVGPSLETGNPIDAFIRAELLKDGLSPSPAASKRELIRRATFDLTGLPPTPEEVEAFVQDTNPNAYPQLIDRLLDSPHYGERWGRHWLDLIRYAQTNGYERDDEKPFAWRYRDYVIRSFNQDKPFNQFVLEQLAGDELPEVTDDSVIATAFYRFCVWDDEPDDISQAVFDGYDDILATTSRALLGLSIGCARCHAHKFDPLPHEDYYRMLAFIRNVNYYLKPEGEQRNIVVVPMPGGGETLGVTERSGLPRPTHVLLRGRVATPGKEVDPGFPQVLSQPNTEEFSIPSDRSGGDKSTGRRLALARWIASSENPLTSRVLANRLWHYHFGRGIVSTPSDFGKTGIPPTHPELLDYLASKLIESNWRLKPLHKQIMLSATYRQSSRAIDPEGLAVDPENKLLWRQNVRRLEAEAIRDAVLATSGQLNLTAGGRGFYPRLPAQVIGSQSMPGRGWGKSSPAERNRRSVYVYAKRSLQLPLLEIFDVASTEQSIAARSRTTVAPQALGLLNSDFITRQADCFAQRLRREVGETKNSPETGTGNQIRRAYALALGREPTVEELRIARGYYERQLKRFRQSAQGYQLAPALPAALHKTFLSHCNGSDFYKDPMPGWAYQRGDWPGRGDSIHWVRLARGPVAFSEEAAVQDGEISCQLKLNKNAEFSSLVFRGHAVGDTWQGYELYLDPQNQSAELRRVGDETVALQKVDARLVAGRWEQIDIAFSGAEIKIALNGKTLFEITDQEPLFDSDRVGLRTWGAELAFRNFFVRDKFQSVEITGNQPKQAEERAMAAVAKLIFNLNEFVYID